MANDRGQDIVEIMRHPAGQLANRLHLGCLRHLAFQFRFLAIVADREQHRSLAQSADPRDPQGDRFLAAAAQPHRQIAGQRRAAGIAPHRIRHGGLVIADHQVAGIERLLVLANAGYFGKSLIEKQEPPVAVGQGQAKRQQRQHRFHLLQRLAALDHAAVIIDQQDQCRPLFLFPVERNMEQAHGGAMASFAFEKDRSLVIGAQEIDEIAARYIGVDPPGCAQGKGLIGRADPPLPADHAGQYADFRKGPAATAADQTDHLVEKVRLDLRRELPEQIFIALPRPDDLCAIFRNAALQALGIAAAIAPCGPASGRQQFIASGLQRQVGRHGCTVEPFGEKLVGTDQTSRPVSDRKSEGRLVRNHPGHRPVFRIGLVMVGRVALRTQEIGDAGQAQHQSEKGDDQADILHLPVEQTRRRQYRHHEQHRPRPHVALHLAGAGVEQSGLVLRLTCHRESGRQEFCSAALCVYVRSTSAIPMN